MPNIFLWNMLNQVVNFHKISVNSSLNFLFVIFIIGKGVCICYFPFCDSYRMDSSRAEALFKKSRMISNITIPTKRPIRPNPMLQRQRARRYSREASLLYNATILDDIKINLNDSVENDTDAESDAVKDLPFNKVIVQTPVQRNDMSYIISNLGHFQDYRIEVSVGLFLKKI